MLFVEAPEGWYLKPAQADPSGDGTVTFAVAVLDQPDGGDLRTVDLRFTLVYAADAIEVLTHVAPAP